MNPERWRAVTEVFHRALERDEAERPGFLEAACGDDAELLREVESLLASHDKAGDFIDTPAYEAAAELLHGPEGGLSSGDDPLVGGRIGPYTVAARLGYGGTGVVYLGKDTRLDRPVAIKALADHLGRDERSRERLRREAKAAAALSHPGIATVFALEEFDRRLYIVYEYAEGKTLRQELADGPVRGRRLFDTALAMARALESAHAHGIVHRDLKPENVIRTGDGGIKILDFGLATFAAPPLAAAESGDRAERLTLPGMLLGTPGYMAPEQLRGREVDFRADLFAFGVLLQEMASGVHPFEGDDPASTIARILEVEPRRLPEQARGDVAEIEPVLQRLLCKNPDDRYASTSDLVADLERIVEGDATLDSSQRPPDAGYDASERHDAFWWWRFHQFAIAIVYAATLYGLWWTKESIVGTAREMLGALLFYAGVGLVIVAASLRIHLAFAARYYPRHLRGQLLRAQRWIRPSEFVYAASLLGGAVFTRTGNTVVATLLVAAASGIVVFALKIEPTTTRAAFPEGPETRDDRKTRS